MNLINITYADEFASPSVVGIVMQDFQGGVLGYIWEFLPIISFVFALVFSVVLLFKMFIKMNR